MSGDSPPLTPLLAVALGRLSRRYSGNSGDFSGCKTDASSRVLFSIRGVSGISFVFPAPKSEIFRAHQHSSLQRPHRFVVMLHRRIERFSEFQHVVRERREPIVNILP